MIFPALKLPPGLNWLHDPTVLLLVGLGSAVVAVVSVLSLPLLLARIPADYFRHPQRALHPGEARWIGRVLKNAFGVVLLAAGIAMLVLPGQGILTILAALVLLDFPGKRRLEQRLIARPRVLKAINHFRARTGHPPLELDPPSAAP